MANVIIMSLSHLKEDAPIKYLLLSLRKKKIDKIITVVTKEAETAFDKFEEMLLYFTEENNIDLPEVIKISDTDEIKTINEVVSKISKDDKVYIESTGGLRNTTYTLMTIVRILEFSGITFRRAVYSDYVKQTIEDITDIYKMYDLINAVNSFTSYGNFSELDKFFRNSKNESVRNAVSAMNDFSEDIMLCRTLHLKDSLKKLNKSLRKLNLKRKSDKYYNIFFEDFMRCYDRKLITSGKRLFTNEHINTIEYLDEILSNTDRYKLGNCTVPEMQVIMRDYLYIKQYIRNKLNHANNEGKKESINERDDYLSNHGYDTEAELTAKEIKDVISNAVYNINKITVK